MSEKKLYQQKKKAQMDEFMAEIAKLKAKASILSADSQLKMSKQIKVLKEKVEDGKKKLTKLELASDDTWDTIKHSVEHAWDSLNYAIREAISKIK